MSYLPTKDRRGIPPAHLANAPVFNPAKFLPPDVITSTAEQFAGPDGLNYCFVQDYLDHIPGHRARMAVKYCLAAFFGDSLQYLTARDLRTVNIDHIYHYVNRVLKAERGLLSSTINTHIGTISALYIWCEKRGAPGVKNPVDWNQLRRLIGHERTRTNPVLMDEEVAAMLRATLFSDGRNRRLAERNYLILLLLFNTGIRRSNVGRLMFHQFSREQGHWIIHLPKTKSSIAQTVKILPWLRAKVMDYCAKRGITSGPLFAATSGPSVGNPISGTTVGVIFRAGVELAQIREYEPGYKKPSLEETGGQRVRNTTAHIARHTFVTKMLGSGVSPIKAMQAARHKSFNTTLGYFEDMTRFDDYGGDVVHFDIE